MKFTIIWLVCFYYVKILSHVSFQGVSVWSSWHKKEQKMETTNDVLKDTGSSMTWVNEAQWVASFQYYMKMSMEISIGKLHSFHATSVGTT